MPNTLNIAVIGAGGFAHFATTEFIKIPDVKLVGIFDQKLDNALQLKKIDNEAIIYDSLENICAEPLIDLVYIATPPHLHYSQSKMALLSGKHVICEKPAATKTEHAVELKTLSEQKHLLFVVNLMQRYNPLYDAVSVLIQENVLGSFLHGFFENYASDEALNEKHWFWDEEKSGGIFIEHGVHFFDMFSGWFGQGQVISSQKSNRPHHPNVWDKAQATVLYAGGLVNFYHGFDQPKIMDRQEMRLLFEKGEVTLSEWVPTRLKIDALCDEKELEQLKSVFPNTTIEIIETHPEPNMVKGRFKEIKYNYKIHLETGERIQKQMLYKELVTAMLNDQLNWIKNKNHKRRINQDNAVDSLKIATEAERLAFKVV